MRIAGALDVPPGVAIATVAPARPPFLSLALARASVLERSCSTCSPRALRPTAVASRRKSVTIAFSWLPLAGYGCVTSTGAIFLSCARFFVDR